MKIAVHGSHLCQEREDGSQNYMINLFRNIAAIDQDNEYDFYYSKDSCKQVEGKQFNHITHKAPLAWTQRVFPSLLRRDKPDLLFMPIQMLPFLKPFQQKSVVTIHDLAFLFYPKTFRAKDVILHRLYVRQAITRADHLIAITQATKDDIVNIYKVPEEKVSVVYHGIDHDRFRAPQEPDQEAIQAVKEKYNITKPYLMYVGNVQPRKNVQGLIRAFDAMKKEGRDDYQLVIAGANAWLVDEIMKDVGDVLSDDIIFTGRFADEELPPLLWGATAFALPSFYEGFGLPILEAAACGTPVLVADTPSMVEVGGEATVSFDPHDIFDIKRKVEMVLDDPELRETMIEKGYARAKEFSWERCAKETTTILNRIGHEAKK